jgi:hypothetical protein
MAPGSANRTGMNATVVPKSVATADTVPAPTRDAPTTCANEAGAIATDWALRE